MLVDTTPTACSCSPPVPLRPGVFLARPASSLRSVATPPRRCRAPLSDDGDQCEPLLSDGELEQGRGGGSPECHVCHAPPPHDCGRTTPAVGRVSLTVRPHHAPPCSGRTPTPRPNRPHPHASRPYHAPHHASSHAATPPRSARPRPPAHPPSRGTHPRHPWSIAPSLGWTAWVGGLAPVDFSFSLDECICRCIMTGSKMSLIHQ